MKKLLLLLIIPLFLTGCYDYQELNNRAIIAGVAIDYEEDAFHINLEILNNKKSSNQEEESSKTYYVKGSGPTLDKAFQDCHSRLSKEPYYSHLKILILGEEVAKEKLSEVLDYMIRDAAIRNIFLPVLAKGSKASEILETTTTENPIVSTSIQSMIENNKTNDSISILKDFEEFTSEIIDPYRDGYINTISKDEDTLLLSGIAAFHEYEFSFFLDTEEAITFNTLNNDSTNYYINIPCENKKEKYITIKLYQNDGTSFEFQENNITVQSKLNASIVEDSCHYDFRKPDTYNKLANLAKPLIEEEYQNVINKLKEEKTDILGISDQYYKKYRTPLDSWYTWNFAYDIEVNINKNGLIFEVKENE